MKLDSTTTWRLGKWKQMRAFDMSPQHCAYYVFSCQFEEIQDTSTKTYTAKPTPFKK